MWMGFYKLIKTPPEILLKIAFLIELTEYKRKKCSLKKYLKIWRISAGFAMNGKK
jgi:hypothetical protein